MNFIDGLVIGLIIGCLITFFGIILFAKYMTKENKETYKGIAKEKWKK